MPTQIAASNGSQPFVFFVYVKNVSAALDNTEHISVNILVQNLDAFYNISNAS